MIARRRLLSGMGAFVGLGTVGAGSLTLPRAARAAGTPMRLTPIAASLDLVTHVTVCLRPFRSMGPRIEAERLGETLVVHNYGHGGSGWSLSWGSAAEAVNLARQGGSQDIAVIGCGALGLTSAITAQRAGAKVTIYARDVLPDTRSARATGIWSPDSRIALDDKTPAGFGDLWERMARTSFRTYNRYVGLPGSPIEYFDQYYVGGTRNEPSAPPQTRPPLSFAEFGSRIHDLVPRSVELSDEASPFPAYTRMTRLLRFNIADYGRVLMGEFLDAGGRIERREFSEPGQILALPQRVVINCPGYGARALWKDETITPVRGQISWLPPHPELDYGVIYKHVSLVPRRDGTVVQGLAGGDMRGFGDEHEAVDPAEMAETVAVAAELAARMTEFNAAIPAN